MEDAQWLPLDLQVKNEETGTQEKIFLEVTSGNWYQRTYDYMLVKHRSNHTATPPLLVALVLGQDGTLCDKLGRVSSEPILISVANIAYSKRKQHHAWFCIGNIPSYPKTQLESQKDSNKVSSKELSGEFYHNSIEFILEELIQIEN